MNRVRLSLARNAYVIARVCALLLTLATASGTVAQQRKDNQGSDNDYTKKIKEYNAALNFDSLNTERAEPPRRRTPGGESDDQE